MKSFILSIAKEAGIDFKEQGSEVKQGEAQEFEEESSRQGIEEDAKDSSTSRDGPGSENRDNQNWLSSQDNLSSRPGYWRRSHVYSRAERL